MTRIVVFALTGLVFTSCQFGNSRTKEIFKAGALAPALELEALDGSKYSSAALKGSVLLVNFWATWCEPCVAEMPSLQRLHQILAPRGLRLLAVNVDSAGNRRIVERFAKEHGLTFPVLLDSRRMTAGRFGISAFPESFFIGRNGEFLNFDDPATGSAAVRVVSDREWDSPQFIEAITRLLQ